MRGPVRVGALPLLMLLVGACRTMAATTVAFEPLRQGATAAVRGSTEGVIARTDAEWDAAWRLAWTGQDGELNGRPQPRPEVDFQRDMVVGVVGAVDGSSCTSLTIVRITHEADHLLVAYQGHAHKPGEVCLTVLESPFAYVRVARGPGDVRLQEVTVDRPGMAVPGPRPGT